jgi:hypothetical protein
MGVMTLMVVLAGLTGSLTAWAEESSPDLTVGHVEIHCADIFSGEEIEEATSLIRFMRQAMNGVHFNTRQYVVRRELLFAEGDPFDPGALAETERNLRNLGYLNRIRVTPTDTTADGRVNILVSTRESWSLQTNLAYARSSGGDTRWSVQFADKNFLGHGATLGAGLGADENSSYWNLWLHKRRVTSLGLQVGIDYAQRGDGHYRGLKLSRPFYAQNDPWAAAVSAWDGQTDVRHYFSNAGPVGVDPTSSSSLYAKLPMRRQGVEFLFQKRLSDPAADRVWRLGVGGRITDQDLELDSQTLWQLSDDRFVDLGFLAEPGQPTARDQGTTVYPYLSLNIQGRGWTKARFIMKYGPVEDIPLDWGLTLRTGPSGPAMGSTTGFGGATWYSELEFSRWLQLGPGLWNVSGGGMWQAGDRDNRFHRFVLNTGWIVRRGPEKHPWITRVFAEYGSGERLAGSEALLLGLSRGLRTLEFDGMAGDRLVRWNLEQGKATDWEVLGLFRLGAAVFYNGGRAWWTDEASDFNDIRHEVGAGLRLGPTRSASANVSRLDVSWALDGSVGPVFTATTRGFF